LKFRIGQINPNPTPSNLRGSKLEMRISPLQIQHFPENSGNPLEDEEFGLIKDHISGNPQFPTLQRFQQIPTYPNLILRMGKSFFP